jgi:hypothetical protein
MPPSPVATGIGALRAMSDVVPISVPWVELSVCMRARLPRGEVESRTGLPTASLLDAIVEMGTWLGLQRGAAPKVPLPPGFSRTACGRDLRRAVSNCATHVLSPEDLPGFPPASQRRTAPVFSIELAQSLCTIDRIRGLDGIEDLARLPDGRLDPVFARSIVLVFDQLTAAIDLAITGVRRLDGMLGSLTPPPGTHEELNRLRWVDPAYVDRLAQALARGDHTWVRARLQHPAGLATRVPRRLGDFRYGQVTMLTRAILGNSA